MSPLSATGTARLDQQRAVWQCVSLLLDYPGDGFAERLALVREVCTALPADMRAPLERFVAHAVAAPVSELQEQYVETFDSRRRCNLFLTYFAHGDTRKRGVALLRFKQTYQDAGFRVDDSELPDHLCVVLEYAATIDPSGGRQLMLDHRAGLELLRLSTRDTDSPWAPLLEAVCATLPPLRGDEREAVQQLALLGPPEEEVGLAPFGAEQPPAPVPLPTPVFPGARR